MILSLDMGSEVPIYVQLRNQIVTAIRETQDYFREKLESELELLSAEASIKGMSEDEFLKVCKKMFQMMHPVLMEEV